MYTICHTVLGQFALFIMYCLFGTLFAGCAVVFVKCLAPYACGSGIPEVTGGFSFSLKKSNLSIVGLKWLTNALLTIDYHIEVYLTTNLGKTAVNQSLTCSV